ncbi:hypothetical protein IH981_02680 [Patescibacteria group bacterium]|nr:hypothetical protein [Patescibacteria group bacterium]
MINKYKPTKLITFLTFLVTFLFVFTTIATAVHDSRGSVLQEADTATPSADKKPKGRDKLKNRLSQIKLKVCEKREASIQKRSTRLAAKAENIQKRFDRIIEKVDTYYIDVLLLKDVEIDNYDALLANVEENRVASATKLGAAESTASNFTCEGEDPKGQVKQFRTDMKAVISALQGYKKSVVNLIVAVRTKAKNVKSPVATDSAKPATGSAEPE